MDAACNPARLNGPYEHRSVPSTRHPVVKVERAGPRGLGTEHRVLGTESAVHNLVALNSASGIPRIHHQLSLVDDLRREVPENLWIKCPETGQLVFYKDVEANQFVLPGSNYHMHMSASARLKSMFDNETW